MLGALLLWLAPSSAAAADPLGSADVLALLDDRHPVLAAATLELARASAQRQQALGAFDVKVKGKVDDIAAGKDLWTRSELALTTETRLFGLALEGGYAQGLGDFPGYYGEKATAPPGEVALGASLPLLRGGWVDAERAGLAIATLEGSVARALRARAGVEVAAGARMAWAKWVAAGRKVTIAADLLRVAEDRDRAISQRIAAGDLPALARLDNQRLIYERQAALAEAERDLVAAAASLALFVRDAEGLPRVPEVGELPAAPALPAAAAGALAEDLGRARAARPELVEISTQRQQLVEARRAAVNDLLPAIDVGARVVQPLSDADKQEIQVGVRLDSPLQQRKARGKLDEIDAKAAALEQKQSFLGDKIDAEVRKARAGLEAARVAAGRLEESAAVAGQLVEAERVRFNAGDTDLLTVWLREQSFADAQKKAVEAWMDAWFARAELDAALGRGPEELRGSGG